MQSLNIHCFQHVPFEGLACIENWVFARNHVLSYTRFYEEHTLPNLDKIDWLTEQFVFVSDTGWAGVWNLNDSCQQRDS